MPAAALPRIGPAPLSGLEKAAILVMYLDRDSARSLLGNLNDEEVDRLATAMAELGDKDQVTVEEVIFEFMDQLRLVTLIPGSGRSFARNVLPTLLPEERRARLGAALRRSGADDFEAFIRSRPPRAVASAIADEHPQVRAVALLRMGTENAARVLACFHPDDQADLAIRMARAEIVSPELADDIETALRRALKGIEDPLHVGGVDRTARILGRMPKVQDVLGGVRAIEDALADDLQRRMVTFDDLEKLDGRSMQALLRVLERNDLLLALKGARPAVRERFFASMSMRAAADFREEIELSGPGRKSETREAQERVVTVARQLAEEGTIVIDLGSDEDDQG